MPARNGSADADNPILNAIQTVRPPRIATNFSFNLSPTMRHYILPPRKDLSIQLISSAAQNDLNAVQTLLSTKRIDVNFSDEYQRTALMRAAMGGQTDIVQTLLSAKGIDPNHTTNLFGYTALMNAAYDGHTETVRALMGAEGIDVNLANRNGDTALTLAVQRDQTEVVRALIDAKDIDVNVTNGDGLSALMIAAKRARTETIQALLDAESINVNVASPSYGTALMRASHWDHIESVQALLNAEGIDVNLANRHGVTPLMVAAQYGHTEIAQTLIDCEGIDVNIENEFGNSALTLAAVNGHVRIVQALLDAGADPSQARQHHSIANSPTLQYFNNHPHRLEDFRAQYLDSFPENLGPIRERAIASLCVNQLRELIVYSQRARNQLGMTDQAVYSQDMTKARFNEIRRGAYSSAAAAHAGGELPDIAMATIAAFRGGDPRDFILNKQSRQAAETAYAQPNTVDLTETIKEK